MIIVVCVAACFAVTVTRAAQPPAGTNALGDDPISLFSLQGKQSELGQLQVIDVPSRPFKRAIRVTTKSLPALEWNLQVSAQNVTPVNKDDVLLAHFWLRCAES